MAENTEFKPPKDMESIYSLFTQDRDKFFKWEKENPDAYFQAILGFVYEDDLSEAKAKYQEYLAAHNKESYRLKFYMTLQIAFDQEFKRRGLSGLEEKQKDT